MFVRAAFDNAVDVGAPVGEAGSESGASGRRDICTIGCAARGAFETPAGGAGTTDEVDGVRGAVRWGAGREGASISEPRAEAGAGGRFGVVARGAGGAGAGAAGKRGVVTVAAAPAREGVVTGVGTCVVGTVVPTARGGAAVALRGATAGCPLGICVGCGRAVGCAPGVGCPGAGCAGVGCAPCTGCAPAAGAPVGSDCPGAAAPGLVAGSPTRAVDAPEDGRPVGATRGAAVRTCIGGAGCITQMIAPQSTMANRIVRTRIPRMRLSRLMGEVGLKRPYPSVASTASVCAAFEWGCGAWRVRPLRSASRMMLI